MFWVLMPWGPASHWTAWFGYIRFGLGAQGTGLRETAHSSVAGKAQLIAP
jgi:hypothetical protein